MENPNARGRVSRHARGIKPPCPERQRLLRSDKVDSDEHQHALACCEEAHAAKADRLSVMECSEEGKTAPWAAAYSMQCEGRHDGAVMPRGSLPCWSRLAFILNAKESYMTASSKFRRVGSASIAGGLMVAGLLLAGSATASPARLAVVDEGRTSHPADAAPALTRYGPYDMAGRWTYETVAGSAACHKCHVCGSVEKPVDHRAWGMSAAKSSSPAMRKMTDL
jgi:hypothetical protein